MERRRRLALWLLSACLTAALLYTGHGAFHKEPPVAFFRPGSGAITVRVKGCVPNPGVYKFPKKAKVATVINMTCPLLMGKIANRAVLEREITSGDVVAVAQNDEQLFEITIERMKAKERIVLGIPLDPDLMDLADWDSLPGIGPVLAKSIMDDRHKNGAFGSVEALRRVPGIGEKRLKELKKYF